MPNKLTLTKGDLTLTLEQAEPITALQVRELIAELQATEPRQSVVCGPSANNPPASTALDSLHKNAPNQLTARGVLLVKSRRQGGLHGVGG